MSSESKGFNKENLILDHNSGLNPVVSNCVTSNNHGGGHRRRSGIKLGLVTVCDNYVKNVDSGHQQQQPKKKNGSSSGEPMRLRLTPDKLILQKEIPISEDEERRVNESIEYQKWLESALNEFKNEVGPSLVDNVRVVKLSRDPTNGLGINVKGGSEHNLPILISSLVKDSPADRSGQLFIGDAIFKVNSITLFPNQTSHEEGIQILKNSGTQVILTVKHFKTVTPFLSKSWKKKVDFDDGELTTSGHGKISVNNNNNNNNNLSKRPKKKEIKVKWTDVISVDLVRCNVTKYIHDTDKIRPNGFEIRWFSGPEKDLTKSQSHHYNHKLNNRRHSNQTEESINKRKTTDNPSSTTTDHHQPHQPRLFSSAIVTCSDYGIYKEWRSEIDKYVNRVNNNYLKAFNNGLTTGEQILFMGWVSQGFPSGKEEPHRPCYRWTTKYLVIKGGDLLLYNNPAHFLNQVNGVDIDDARDERRHSKSGPEHSKLTTTTATTAGQFQVFKAYQSVLRCLRSAELVDERQHCFILLSTKESNSEADIHTITTSPPVSVKSTFGPNSRNCYLSVETGQELTRIKAAWNKATYYSVTQLGSKTFSVICEGKCGKLTLDWKIGFAFYCPLDKCYKWCYRFSQLKCSSDDGRNKLCLQFHTNNSAVKSRVNPSIPYQDQDQTENSRTSDATTVTKELTSSCLQNLLYCMHSFLSAKVSSVDPSFL